MIDSLKDELAQARAEVVELTRERNGLRIENDRLKDELRAWKSMHNDSVREMEHKLDLIKHAIEHDTVAKPTAGKREGFMVGTWLNPGEVLVRLNVEELYPTPKDSEGQKEG